MSESGKHFNGKIVTKLEFMGIYPENMAIPKIFQIDVPVKNGIEDQIRVPAILLANC